ncbi:MAG: class I SAM-dependent methyltransferase [Oceanospirillaceae bacterium]|nr:class I SAM-dependent methyltransferase [Oceanospirillaceae bacterium]
MAINVQKQQGFLDQVISELAAGYNGVMVSLGHKLGLYRALDGAGPLNSDQVAVRAGCAERYVREWLNSQVAGGYLEYHPASRTYELPEEHRAVLSDEDSPVFMPPAWEVPASMWLDEDKSLHAFRTGEGVPWGDHSHRLFCGSAAFYRNAYRGSLIQEWLPALDGVLQRLEQGIRVADVGCGHGHSTVLMAQAFPASRFRGFDAHPASLAAAEQQARDAAVSDRVSFTLSDALEYPGPGFDLICFFDCLHDMGDPVGAARHAAERLNEGGTVMLVEPFAHDRLEENKGPVARLYYSASTTICCAHSLSEREGTALGAQAGEARLAEVFRQAGFSHFRCAKRTPFNLILEARR